ncbi:mechanosensitive ion channel family protein [bacterium]|nr:mechanosensitive ion channel family protein [bacterium]
MMRRIWAILAISLLVGSLFSLMAEEAGKTEQAAAKAKSLVSWEDKIQPIVEKIEILRREIFNIALWQYGLFALVVLGAVIFSKVIDFLVIVRLKKLTARTRTPLDDIAIEVMRKPLRLIIVIAGIILGLRIFQVDVKNLLGVLVGIVVTYTLVKLVDLFAAYLEPKVRTTDSKLDDQLLPIIRKTLKIFIVTVGVLVILESLQIKVTGFLAGLGVGGLAFALAAKETLANMFGSIAIFADKPFRVGDRVIVEGIDGPVESIGLRSTRIRTLDGTLVTIPNARMAEATINNISKRPTIKNLYTVGVTYDTGYDKMKNALEILRGIFKNHPSTENYWVYFKEFGAHSKDILVIHWCKYTAYQQFLEATEEINLEIMRRFEEADIEFAFPTQTVYLKQEEGETK